MIFKTVQIISDTNKSLAFEIIAKGLKERQINIAYILIQNGKSDFSDFLEENDIEYFIIPFKGKISYPLVILKLISLFLKLKPNIIHTHLRDANILGLTVAKLFRIKIRIHTRHHSTSNHEYHPHAVKWDKYVNRLSSHIISISKNVSEVLTSKEKVPSNKISIIPHGLDLNKFSLLDNRIIKKLKDKHNIPLDGHPIVGAISRYVHLKGHQYIIPAFAEVKKCYPNAHLVLANATGADSQQIKDLLANVLKPEDFTEIAFENDLFHLYGVFDFFIHAPINKEIEAFGQTYIESLAAKIPSIFTLSGIAREFIVHEHNALVVPYCSSKDITTSLLRLIKNHDLCKDLSINGFDSVQSFSANNYILNHVNLYNKLCHQKDKK